MNACINSLSTYYKKKELVVNSASFIDLYSPWLTDEEICDLFFNVFNEKPSLFDINGHAKETVEGLMISYYHNEAFIKAALIKEFKKNHGTISFFELPVGDSRADLCSINGNSVAYEIKTIYDTTKRLLKQVNDYLKVFEFVYVVCPEEMVESIINIVPSEVGIYKYDNKKRKPIFEIVKAATLSESINSKSQIALLRRSEQPDNLHSLSVDEVNCLFKQTLKKRYSHKWKTLCKNIRNIFQMDYQYYFNNY